MAEFPEPAHRLHPAEALFDTFAVPLTDRIAGMPRRAPIDRTPAAGGVGGHVRGDVQGAQIGDEIARVVAFVRGKGDPAAMRAARDDLSRSERVDALADLKKELIQMSAVGVWWAEDAARRLEAVEQALNAEQEHSDLQGVGR